MMINSTSRRKQTFDDIAQNAFSQATMHTQNGEVVFKKPDVGQAYKLYQSYNDLKQNKASREDVANKLSELLEAVKICAEHNRGGFSHFQKAIENHPLLKGGDQKLPEQENKAIKRSKFKSGFKQK